LLQWGRAQTSAEMAPKSVNAEYDYRLQWGRANEERGNGTCVSGSIRTAEITDFERAHFHN